MKRVLVALASVVALLLAGPASAAPLPVSYHFLQDAVTYGSLPSPPGANLWKCRPSAAHPTPVVLVHGTAGNAASNWASMSASLKNNGYCVYALTYGVSEINQDFPVKFGGMDYLQNSARQLGRFIAKVRTATGASRVDIVGHSQGAFMPEVYAKLQGGTKFIRRYVSIAPLWHGVGGDPTLLTMATMFGVAPEDLVPICHACPQMATGSAMVNRIRQGGTALPGIVYTNIVTEYDDVIINHESGFDAGMRNILLQDVCAQDFSDHLQIPASPTTIDLVLNALDPAHRRAPRCRLVLPVNG